MKPIQIDNYGFPGVLTELIARSAMSLPSLDIKRDAGFLRDVGGIVMTVFLAKYLRRMPGERQTELQDILNGSSEEELKRWLEMHCNFLEDAESRKRAEWVLAELQAALPELLKQEYNSWIMLHTSIT